MFKCSLKIASGELKFHPFIHWHSESSSAVTLLLHADWMMLKNASNQGGANSVISTRKSAVDAGRFGKAAFHENYLTVRTCILNGSSIECHEKKNQTFSLSGVGFGSRAIHSAWR